MRVYEKVWLEPQKFVVVEALDENKKPTGRVILRGRAIKAGVPTRNGVSYTRESLQRYCDYFNQNKKKIPHLDTHDDSTLKNSLGHVCKLFMNGDDLMYEIDVDPEEKDYIRKVKRGDIGEVSIQAIVDQVDSKEDLNTGDQYIVADVRELLEISGVLIPGSRDSNMQMLEKLGVHNANESNLHTYEKKFGLAVTEKRLVEKFNKGLYKESIQDEEPKISGENPLKDEDENPNTKNLQKPNREDINTSNSNNLTETDLAKKIKPTAETLIARTEKLKILTKRFNFGGNKK